MARAGSGNVPLSNRCVCQLESVAAVAGLQHNDALLPAAAAVSATAAKPSSSPSATQPGARLTVRTHARMRLIVATLLLTVQAGCTRQA